MNGQRSARILLLLVFSALIALPGIVRAQLALGQYEPEAPLRTWNTFGFESAASIGRGGTSFALVEDPATALSNPALLVDLPGTALILNGASNSASLYRYALVNTGVLRSDENLTLHSLALDFGGVSFRWGDWAFGLGAAISEIYDRPGVNYEYRTQGELAYRLDFSQSGFLRVIHLSVARRFGSRFRVGLGINSAGGGLDRETVESYPRSGVTISDRKEHDFSGMFINGGIAAALFSRLEAALVFRTPYMKKAESRSRLRYSAPAGGTDIRIDADAEDHFRQPLALGFGLSFRVSRATRLLADASYFDWSNYRITFLGEDLERNFKNTIKLNIGAETMIVLNIFGSKAALPLRIGMSYDPQPVREPASSYTSFSAGIGLRWRIIALDCGASLGSEKGSGRSLEARRISFSLGLRL